MITWAGFLGKLLPFLLIKIEDANVQPNPVQRKTAAKALRQLHEAITELEAVSLEFLRETQPALLHKQPRLYRMLFVDIARAADSASKSFIRSFHGVHKVIGIYDPNLEILLSDIALSES
jgi:hypothetical protein